MVYLRQCEEPQERKNCKTPVVVKKSTEITSAALIENKKETEKNNWALIFSLTLIIYGSSLTCPIILFEVLITLSTTTLHEIHKYRSCT